MSAVLLRKISLVILKIRKTIPKSKSVEISLPTRVMLLYSLGSRLMNPEKNLTIFIGTVP
jgi:hypothetical protein